MDFEQYMRRPVYTVHCKTTAVARALCCIALLPTQGYATNLHSNDKTGLTTFRPLKPFRTAEAIRLRAQVASVMRSRRKSALQASTSV